MRLIKCILSVSIMLHVSGHAAASGAADLRARTLVIGKVSDSPRKHFTRLKPMVEYVGKKMADLGITRTRVLMAKNNAQMIRYLREGKVDWVTETVFSSLVFRDQAGAEIILRKWKKGVPGYHTVFFTRKESDIHTLKDLQGRRIALEDPGSTTAFFVPMTILFGEGLQPEKLKTIRSTPSPDKVGYGFAGGEINIATWVYQGLADAGAYNDLDWNTPDHTPPSFKKDLRIFHRAEKMPRGFELVRSDLDPKIKIRLKKILLEIGKDPDAGDVLFSYQRTARFDEIDDETNAVLEVVRQQMVRLAGKLH
ncbi:phosphate/phosphite/phosphonate ABC transporter substrate-binding protein [endosymbiont of Lamellibrachia barhami]|uniref:phosphate/phosphite/phosphonate ABC transporter substrate-binding protein n=1 Tax=endosymbiont of Lamellibrachia barhami TaxID=205975 RepID=UPI001FE6F17F|nr:phosphate/phosphite/phosphonate ABC transporter substrate-binding protein [endosymbiont of Lamellibrachia barhami]